MSVSSDIVKTYLDAGLVILPSNKKMKRPVGIVKWQEKTVADATAIWTKPLTTEQDAISLVCGKASGNVEIIDFDAKGVKFDPWKNLIPVELIAKLVVERSPSGGYHVGYRCPAIEGNFKLASETVAVAADKIQDNNGKFTTTIWGKVLPVIDGQAVVELIETRGEGGQCLIAPSPGYELIQGDWSKIPTITPLEREVLIQAARSFNRVKTISAPVVALPGMTIANAAEGRDMSKPWNRFNAEATQADVIAMLEKLGWSIFIGGDPTQLSRPGITDHAGGSVYEKGGQLAIFHCFTSDASPFEPEQNCTPFEVYAIAEHGGDIKAAGRALALSAKYGMSKDTTGLQPTDPTDIGNADKFVSRYGDQLRYVRQWKKWICWNGFYWQTLFNEQVISTLVYPFVRNTLPALAAQITDDDKRKKWYCWVASSQSANRTNAIAEMAGNMLSVNVEEIKTDPWLFACENAIIDLRTQLPIEPKKEQWITYLAPIQYNPAATCHAWDHFIADIFVNADLTPCPELVEYVHRALGYCLTSSVEEQVFFIAHGTGKNGKSTLFEALQGIMGEYAVTGDSTLYFERRDQSNSEDIARLWHKHLCITAETQQGSKLSDSKIKRLTGGDRLTASRKYEHTFDFAPTHKLVLLCNFLPRINVTDPALLRRIKIIPFYYVVPEDKRDNNLKEKLTAEASGILNWLLAGLAKWQTTKLYADKNTPAICRAAKDAYIEDNDSLLDFRNECLTTAKGPKEEKGVVFLRYAEWANRNGISHTLSAKGLTEKLTLAGYKIQQSNSKRYWLDIQVSNPG